MSNTNINAQYYTGDLTRNLIISVLSLLTLLYFIYLITYDFVIMCYVYLIDYNR